MELIYYFKNIDSLTVESTNFFLNDEEFQKIQKMSKSIDKNVFILFWQFAIKTLNELDIVSNQHLSIEMFLMRLMYISKSEPKHENLTNSNPSNIKKNQDVISDLKSDAVNQIKNIVQEKKVKTEAQPMTKVEIINSITSFDELIEACAQNKEIKLKYELEKNVNLVSFEKNRIEISFNDKLDKNFVKDISLKLFEWTGQRWMITLSKTKGQISIKEKELKNKNQLIERSKSSKLYKDVIEKFPDANLEEVISNNGENKI